MASLDWVGLCPPNFICCDHANPKYVGTGTLGTVPESHETSIILFFILTRRKPASCAIICSDSFLKCSKFWDRWSFFWCLMSLIINLNPSQVEWVLQRQISIARNCPLYFAWILLTPIPKSQSIYKEKKLLNKLMSSCVLIMTWHGGFPPALAQHLQKPKCQWHQWFSEMIESLIKKEDENTGVKIL